LTIVDHSATHSAIVKATKPSTVAASVRRTELPLADQPTSGCC
jgi:hypothetical protein